MKQYLLLIFIVAFCHLHLFSQKADRLSKENIETLKKIRNHEIVPRNELFSVFNFFADDYSDSLQSFAVYIFKTGIEQDNRLYLNLGKSYLGVYFSGIQNTDMAIQLARGALSYYESILDYEMLVFSYNQLGINLVKERNYRDAHNAFDKAIKYAENTSNYKKNIYPMKSAAEAYYREEKYEEAIQSTDFLIKNLDHNLNYYSLLSAYLIKGKALLALGEKDKAEKYFDKAYKLDNDSPSYFIRGGLLTNLGMLFYEDDAERAKKLFLESLEVNYKSGKVDAIAISLFNLGMWYAVEGDNDSSLFYYNELLDFSQKNGYKQGLLDAYGGMGEIYEDEGNYKKAYELLSEFRDIEQGQILSRDQTRQKEIMLAFDLLRQESLLVQAEAEGTLFERVYTSEHKLKTLALLVLAVSFSFLLIFYIKNKNERKTAIILKDKES